jgi:hypothetical protein
LLRPTLAVRSPGVTADLAAWIDFDVSLSPEATAALLGAAVGVLGSWGLAALTSMLAARRERRVAALLITTELTTVVAALSMLRAYGIVTHPFPSAWQSLWQQHGKALLYGADLGQAGTFATAYSRVGDVAALCSNARGHDFTTGTDAEIADGAFDEALRALDAATRLSGQLTKAEREKRIEDIRERHRAEVGTARLDGGPEIF